MKTALALALLFAVGCSTASSAQDGAGGGGVGDAAVTAFDQQFIDTMAPHHEGAVAMALIARARGEHAEIKTLAEAIISSGQQEVEALKSWRKAWYGSDQTPPVGSMSSLGGMDHATHHDVGRGIETLKTATPFDRAFLDEMIPHHASAIEAARLAQERAEHAEIKTQASQSIASHQREIDQMTSWRTQWYGSSLPPGEAPDAGAADSGGGHGGHTGH